MKLAAFIFLVAIIGACGGEANPATPTVTAVPSPVIQATPAPTPDVAATVIAAVATATQAATVTQTVAATRTATPTKVATPIVRPTPVVELTSSDADCENMGTHIYCLSSQLTAPTGAILTWGELTGESPEIFCAVDATVQVCEWVANGLLSAIRLWGNYAPMEYWVLGTELAAADDLNGVNCARRAERAQMRLVDCERTR